MRTRLMLTAQSDTGTPNTSNAITAIWLSRSPPHADTLSRILIADLVPSPPYFLLSFPLRLFAILFVVNHKYISLAYASDSS